MRLLAPNTPSAWILCLMLSSIVASTTSALAATKVAVVSDRTNPTVNVVDLAVAKLSLDGNLELVERDEIQRVMAEQKLSATGIVDANQVIDLGKLLKTDLFAVVESPAVKESLPSVVVFDAHNGIRYWDAVLSVDRNDLAAQVEGVVAAVRASSEKRGRQQQGLRTIGFVAVRNADLPRAQDALCETVGFLVERNLPRSPDVAVLERRRLARVNEERSLPGAADANQLLAALTIVDLEIGRGDRGRGLRATALLRNNGQTEAESVSVSTADVDPVALAETLSRKLIEALHATPAAGKPDPRVEARRFDSEAQHHISHQQFAEAARTEEAAFALDSTNEDYAERLSLYLVRYCLYLFGPTQTTVTKGGDRAWTDVTLEAPVLQKLLTAAHRSVELNLSLTRMSAHHPPYNQTLSMLCDRLRGYHKVAPESVRPEVADWLELCRRRSLDYCETWAKKAEADLKRHDAYTSALYLEANLIKSSSIDTAQFAQCMSTLAHRWVAVTKSVTPEMSPSDGGELLNSVLNTFVAPINWPWTIDAREYAKGMKPVYPEMQQHQRAIVRLYGVLGQIRGDVLLGDKSEEQGYAEFAAAYRPLAQSTIESPKPWPARRTRDAVYEAWRTAIEGMPGKNRQDFTTREYSALCSFMIDRHELVYKSLQAAFGQMDRRQAYDLIQRALPVLDSPRLEESDSEKARLRSLMKTTEQSILIALPELAKSSSQIPWTKATKLYDQAQSRELSELQGCVQIDKALFGIAMQFQQERGGLRMFRISRMGQTPELLGWADLGMSMASLPGHLRYSFVPAICQHEGSVYVATQGAGIVVFPPKNGEPRRIDLEKGLPSNKVRSLAVLDSKLFAGFDDGYLAAYDLKTDQCEVLASSRRKQKLSPFDDSDVFRVPMLVADPARERIVFVIGKQVWQYTMDGKFGPIVNLIDIAKGRSEPKLVGNNITWSSPTRGDRVYLSNAFHVIEIDVTKDRGTELHAPEFGVYPMHPPHLVVAGQLWAAGSFSKLSLDKREFQSLPHPGGGTTAFRPTACLELTSDGRQMIAADQFSVWLLDLVKHHD